MEDNLDKFFSSNEFDIHEPHSGHFKRFEKKLLEKKPSKTRSWAWMSVAASILLSIGFVLGNINESDFFNSSSASSKMAETQTFFTSAIQVEVANLEKNRNLETEKIIESALDQLEELEDNYKEFVKKLDKKEEPNKILNAMINNYQQRLEILKKALNQIEILKKSRNLEGELFT